MSDERWKDCKTLGKGEKASPFQWKRGRKGEIRHRSLGESGKGSPIKQGTYDNVIETVSANPDGFSRDQLENEVPAITPQQASRLPAILVQEGLWDYEYHGKAIWLQLAEVREISYWSSDTVTDSPDEGLFELGAYLNDVEGTKARANGKLDALKMSITDSKGELFPKIEIEPHSLEAGWPGVEKELKELESKSTACHFIYVFKVTENYVDAYREALDIAKSDKKSGYKYSRINKQEVDNGVLYVGSCQNKICTRMKQHLGHGSKGTYSLHMKQWAKKLKGPITLHILQFAQQQTVPAALQAIEDSLWADLRPAFGRQGSL